MRRKLEIVREIQSLLSLHIASAHGSTSSEKADEYNKRVKRIQELFLLLQRGA